MSKPPAMYETLRILLCIWEALNKLELCYQN